MNAVRRIRPPVCSRGFTGWTTLNISFRRNLSVRLAEKKRVFDNEKRTNTPKTAGNNQITLARARDEFGITVEDVSHLKHKLMRSPYEDGESIKVYLEDDIIRIASEKKLSQFTAWHNDIEKYKIRQNERMEQIDQRDKAKNTEDDSSRSVIYWQFTGNFSIFTLKAIFAIQSGSASMVSEAVHSFVDTMNSIVLFYGVQTSKKSPSVEHPYGYENIRYITSLVSGVGIFCLGAGVSFWHGVQSAWVPHVLGADLTLAYLTLFISAGIDAIVLGKALLTAQEKATEENTTLFKFIKSGSDPSVNVILMEDSCAVVGCAVAASCMYLTQITSNHYFDAAGSMIIGGMLGGVATFLMRQNSRYLIGKSIPQDVVLEIQDHLEAHPAIKGVYDMKATFIGPNIIRLKAEIDIDGSVIATEYLEQLTRSEIGEQIIWITQQEDYVKRTAVTKKVLVHHINGGVDHVGKEIDKIEISIKARFPNVKHVDLEIL